MLFDFDLRAEILLPVTQAVLTANTIEVKSICYSVVVCSKKTIYTALPYRVYKYRNQFVL